MSNLSGKFDLYDFMSGMGGWYDRNGNPVKMGQDGVSAYYSDIYQDFEAFKKATGGVIHQNIILNDISEYAASRIAEKKDSMLEVVEHKETVVDKRCKEGKREKTTNTYKYFGKEFDLKGLNDFGVCVTTDVKFESILDLIPFLPYLVSSSYRSNGICSVTIGSESYVEEDRKEMLSFGCDDSIAAHYRRAMAELYYEVCKNYLYYKLNERTHKEFIDRNKLVKINDTEYEYTLPDNVDCNHDVSWKWVSGERKTHWASPKYVEGNKIVLEMNDVDEFLSEDIDSKKVYIEYVAYPEEGFPILAC